SPSAWSDASGSPGSCVQLLAAEPGLRHGDDLEALLALGDADRLVDGDVLQHLHLAGAWPADLEARDPGRLAGADRLPQRVGAEAAAAVDVAVDVALGDPDLVLEIGVLAGF